MLLPLSQEGGKGRKGEGRGVERRGEGLGVSGYEDNLGAACLLYMASWEDLD